MFNSACEQLMFVDVEHLLRDLFPKFKNKDSLLIPSVEKLNTFFKHKNHNQKQLLFVVQDRSLAYPNLSYEERIYQHGLIATRKNCWHDFFNALIWLKFPKTKTAINAIHYHEIQKQKSNVRSKKRDLLTLFDECGVVVVANEDSCTLIKQHSWRQLFIDNKSQWLNGSIKSITFGHAMYEKYLNPYVGMTAKVLFLSSDVVDVDAFIAKNLLSRDILKSSKELSPLPVLGIPNWHSTQDDLFYANTDYFRPLRKL